ncbi:MAG TPA: hypothetical protein VF456_14230 [Vicinamibacterales bacterium]
MSRIWKQMILRAAIAAPLIVLTCVSVVRAQAYTPPQGEGAVSFLYQDMFVKYHYFGPARADNGQITSRMMVMDVTYGITDKLAVSAGLPWVAARYNGTKPHPIAWNSSIPSPLDDGSFHSTLQDFHFDVRYNVTKRGIVLTPFVGTTIPSHDYTYFAHAAPGLGLKELQFGASAAKLLDKFVPGLFVQARYGYAVTEKTVEFAHNRSLVDLEVGYFVSPKLRLLALTVGQRSHGGLDLTPNSRVDLGPLFEHHDQIARVNFLNEGGGVAYTVNQKIDLYGSLIRTVSERNGHAIDHGLSLGLSWSFSARRAGSRAIASADHSLSKCMCE